MKIEKLKKRLEKSRPMTTISICFPEDVIEDLKTIAPLRGFSGYQPLLRTYVGKGLRTDLEHFESDTVSTFVENLKRLGVEDETIRQALNDAVSG